MNPFTQKNNSQNQILAAEDMAALIGVAESEFSEVTLSIIEQHNFQYMSLDKAERDKLLLQLVMNIVDGDLQQVGAHRQDLWDRNWKAHKDEFISSDFNPKACVPSFFQGHNYFRLHQEYYKSIDPEFLLNFYRVLRSVVFDRYFADIDCLYEFGCGSGYNLGAFAEQYPDKKCVGLDWSAEAVEMVDLLGRRLHYDMHGRRFDFFNPAKDLRLDSNCAVFTNGALEQVGDNHRPFLEYLLAQNPKICVNIEPILEFYDANNLPDYLAIQYHLKRNYLKNYFTTLKDLENKKRIQIIEARRSCFGNVYNEWCNIVVWRVLA